MQAFLIAIQFLTRIPVPLKIEWNEKSMARSLLFYPVVGLLIGIVLWGVSLLLVNVSPLLSAAVVLLFWAGITGGLHLDGLADSADAWAGGHGDRQKTLDIMKDPSAGPIAVVVLVLVLMIKFASLNVLLESGGMQWLIFVPVLGRMAVLLLFVTTPYVREQGLASQVVEHFNRRAAIAVLLLSLLAMMLLMSIVKALIISGSCVLLLLGLRRIMMQRIQGCTGDTLGASIELVETLAVFVVVVVFVSIQG